MRCSRSLSGYWRKEPIGVVRMASASVPITMASRCSAASAGRSIGIELSVTAMAMVRNPRQRSCRWARRPHVHGTGNTLPIATRTARRLGGSHVSTWP